MSGSLTDAEKKVLLRVARDAMEHAVKGSPLPPIDSSLMTANLKEPGASFVTLTIHGELRGCIGALEAYQPLVEDVREHAVAAALEDPRFPAVDSSELSTIKLEVSRLTAPQRLDYSSPEDLLQRVRPHVDGVILKDGYRRATFLPQVWEQIHSTIEFLERLSVKMGAKPDHWRSASVQVWVYQVEEFHE